MGERACPSGDVPNRDGFDAVFAGFYAVFRRGKRRCASADVLTGTVFVLTGMC